MSAPRMVRCSPDERRTPVLADISAKFFGTDGHFLTPKFPQENRMRQMHEHDAAKIARSMLPESVILEAMARAVTLAQNGPKWGINPQVGCVILHPDGHTLAEGWHRGAGTAHAEVDALNNLTRPSDAIGSVVVVSLEPCNHIGLTGPCSEALISAGVGAVFFGVHDPNIRSAGGAKKLASAGIMVQSGIAAKKVEKQIAPWLGATRMQRPFVTLKWASSLDGQAAAADGTSQWITGKKARNDVHLRRSDADALAVGTGTILSDNPRLTARTPAGELREHQPQIVLIGQRPVPESSQIFQHPQPVQHYRTRDLGLVLEELWREGVHSLFVEGGPTLTSAFLRAGFADELVVYCAPILLGGPKNALGELGVFSMPEAHTFTFVSHRTLGKDIRIIARKRKEKRDVHRNH